MTEPLISVPRLQRFAPDCDAERWAPALQTAAERFAIATPRRAAHWLAQLSVESSGLKRFAENLDYSAERLCAVWPNRFPSVAIAQRFAHDPEALASRAYDGRLGNVLPGDGFRYRGRGCLMITGRANYAHYGQVLGIDLVNQPELAAEPDTGALIAGAYWSDRGLNALADRGDVKGITRAINGGLTGLDDRIRQLVRANLALTS